MKQDASDKISLTERSLVNSTENELKGYFPRLIPAVMMSCILGAHFMRWGQPGLVVVALLSPLLLIFRKRWTLVVYQVLLVAGAIRWVQIMALMIIRRSMQGLPWTRAAVIMGSVAAATLVAALLLRTRPFRIRHNRNTSSALSSVASFIAVMVLCLFPHIKMEHPVPLIAERLLPGSGWIEIILLGLYAGWLSGKLTESKETSPLRSRAWIFFSVVFFLQLVLGLSGFSLFLMTGKLHFPIPAMIIAGPIYRGAFSFFMPMLLIATVIIAGPAWCSWFCYFGYWDLAASKTTATGKMKIGNSIYSRIGVLAVLVLFALLLRFSGLPGMITIIAALLFGLTGIGVIIGVSKIKGIMFHCTHFCPIGLITTTVGKLSPFRIRIGEKCTSCHVCLKSCRYGALTEDYILKKHPGLTCTLCGDCLSACPTKQIEYRFPGLKPPAARSLFLVIVVVIHTLFFGFGRI